MITADDVPGANSDGALLDLLLAELRSKLPRKNNLDDFVASIQALPDGLRAMAATYDLDVSLAVDDLGWHFGNWHHMGLAHETSSGLRKLGANELAEIFDQAFALCRNYWSELGAESWAQWYRGSDLDSRLLPLNNQAWELLSEQEFGIFGYWLSYARKNPAALLSNPSPLPPPARGGGTKSSDAWL